MSFTIKVRSAGGPMLAEYMCPEHGRFELVVPRGENGDPPGTHPCVFAIGADGSRDGDLVTWTEVPCGMTADHVISAPAVHTQFVVSATQGKSAPKPHRDAMDTRLIAEGRKNEYKRQRKEVREAARKRRVMELLK